MRAAVHPLNRDSVSNGRRYHRKGTVDGRSHAFRRWRDLFIACRAELGHEPSAVETTLLRQAADLALASETMSAAIAAGQMVDDERLGRLSFSLRRTLATLGLVGQEPEPAERHSLEQMMADR
jgi:hypothetical protein